MKARWLVVGLALTGLGAVGCGDDAGASVEVDAAVEVDAVVDAAEAAEVDAAEAAEVDAAEAAEVDAAVDAEVDAEVAVAVDARLDASVPKPRVQVVLFTHIEDQTPGGTLGTPQSRIMYENLRAKLIEVAEIAARDQVVWVLQPDWKILEAARLYEDATLMAGTGGKNFLRYLRDDLGVFIDPHSHENGGYNYADVAHLLELLGVGGSTVIGGHIWDPTLPQFQHWDRFRSPVHGEKYPDAVWRGDILIGSGTPNHVNDPTISGVWRPASAHDYFSDDPVANIVAVGQWHDGVSGVQALVDLYAVGTVAATNMLTASWNVAPLEITAQDGPQHIEQAVFLPLKAMEDAGEIKLTDFTTLVEVWRTRFAGRAYVYSP